MAGFIPNEGELLIGQVLARRTHTDRDANLELGLFITAAPGETITFASLTNPTGAGSTAVTLTDADWTVAVSGTSYVASHATITFTATAAWTGTVQGYYIATYSSGGTRRLICVEVDGSGPYTMATNDTYSVVPQITIE